MNNGKFRRKNRRFHIRNVLVLVSLALVITAIGGTIAYLIDTEEPIQNVFTPSQVTSLVVEDVFHGETKTNVKIQNTGDVSAFIRAEVVVTWMSEDGDKVRPSGPVKGEDYTIKMGSGWFEKDGYWYWPSEVAKDGYSDVLIKRATANKTMTDSEGTDYYVAIEILSSAIQSDGVKSDGTHPVEEAWSVTYNAGDPVTIS